MTPHGRHSRRARRRAPRIGGVLALAASLLSACSSTPADPAAAYREALLEARAHKDAAFRNQPDEPIPVGRYDEFLPLKYYEPDQSYEVPATLTLAPQRIALKIPTSTGKLRDMEVIGTLGFTLHGRKHALDTLTEAGSPPDRLFIPFADLTTGTETYAGGRYMEIEKSPTGIYVIDFNRAFHPFCYYNARYDCPHPPAQNRLPVAIRAGERMGTALTPVR